VLEDSTYTDAAVVALSRAFHWVEVNRDHTPEITRRFNVSAHPSLITIGRNEEKVHRFSGYAEPDPFIDRLSDALRRYALYQNGEEWDRSHPRPERISESGIIATIPAPSDEVASGMTRLGPDLWVAQGGLLYRLDPDTGSVRGSFEIGASVRDLCTDGRLLYGMEYGWTAGKPIHVIDPAGGSVVRTIITQANVGNPVHGAVGVAWMNDRLYVLAGMRGEISEVDPATGEVSRVIRCDEQWLTSLDSDGSRFVVTGRRALMVVDPETGKVLQNVPTNYGLRCVAWHKGTYFLMEQPVFGFDRQHERVQVWPQETLIYRIIDPWKN
jgi:hypothetical protein